MPEVKKFGSFFKTVGGNEGNKCHYPTRLDTYGCGCGHDCQYCYAKSLLDFRKLWNPSNPSVVDIDEVRKVVKRVAKKTPSVILRLGGMTDCFQPCELTYRATYNTIKILNEYHVGYLIVTKSHLVAEPEYLEIYDPLLAHFQITVTTFDDNLSLQYEKASIPSKRVAAIEKLNALGFDIALRLSPYVEGYVDFDKLNRVNCDKILVEFLRVNGWIKKWFNIDYSQYTIKQSGYYHLPLEIKQEVIKKITGFKEVTVCEDESNAYAYWHDNFNPNPNDCCNLRIVHTN